MSSVHNFVLFAPGGAYPPDLPWEVTPDAPKVARWIRLDSECHGDGKMMEGDLFALVVNGRDPQLVIDAFRDWSERELVAANGEAVLIVRRQSSDHAEVYSSRDGAPRLLGAVRSRGRGGLI